MHTSFLFKPEMHTTPFLINGLSFNINFSIESREDSLNGSLDSDKANSAPSSTSNRTEGYFQMNQPENMTDSQKPILDEKDLTIKDLNVNNNSNADTSTT